MLPTLLLLLVLLALDMEGRLGRGALLFLVGALALVPAPVAFLGTVFFLAAAATGTAVVDLGGGAAAAFVVEVEGAAAVGVVELGNDDIV